MITIKRTAIWYALREITIEKPIVLPYSKEEIHELFFDQKKDSEGNIYYELNRIMCNVIAKIDCSNISFDNVKLSGLNLSTVNNLRFNPQNIYQRNLSNTTLSSDVEIIGNENLNQKDLFEGVSITGTNFNYCKNVKINPQTVLNKDLSHCSLAGVDFTGFSFDGASLWYTNFKGCIGAKLDPNKVRNFEHADSIEDVELTDLPQDDTYSKASGAKNYYSLRQTITDIQLEFKKLIKDQLPEEQKEEKAEDIAAQPIEQPKQKRKWFGNY